MKFKVEHIGSGEGACFTLGLYSDDLKTHYQSCSLPIEALPEDAEEDMYYDLNKLGKINREPFNWLPS